MKLQGRLLIASLATTTLLLAGCVVQPVHEPYYGPVVRVAPPAPYYEYPGTPPVVGYIWISGYWSWGGVRYVWVPGRWEAPRHGHYWVPHRWEREGEHWRQQGGRWERGNAPQAVPAPAPRIERHEEQREYRPAPGPVYPPPRVEPQERQRFEQQERQRYEYQERQRIEQQERRQPESGSVYRPAPERNTGSGEREIRRQPDNGGAVRFERRDGPRNERDVRPAPDRDGERRPQRRDEDDRR
jgi:hypothetical protein